MDLYYKSLYFCRDDLPSNSFRSRKYGDKFAEKLASILPEFKILRKLEFCGASLTAIGAASLTSGLQNCPHITEINLSDNNLQDEGIRHVTQIFTKLQSLASVMLGRNNTSLKAVEYLVQEMSSCLNIQHIHADGTKEVTVTFFQKSDANSHKSKLEPTISLLNQKWSKADMTTLAKSLVKLPALSVLDLSGGQWDEDILRTLAEFVPKFSISERIILNDSCSSVECVVALTALLSVCLVTELHIRLQNPVQVSVIFPEESEKPVDEMSKKLCLSCCDLLPADFSRVWRSLGTSSGLTVLDLSDNRLGDKGLKKLLDVLPRLSRIQEINASNNGVSMTGVVMLAGALCSCNTLKHIYISDGGRQQVILKFNPKESNDKEQIKMFRINNSNLQASHISDVCRKLVPCRFHLELEFLHCSFAERAIDNLRKVLPTMSSLQRLNVSNSITSTTDALTLINCLNKNQRVTSVELSPRSESFICFDRVKAKQVSCRLAYFCFKEENVALMEKLLENLQLSQQLSYLDLSSNQLEDEEVKILVDCLPRLRISRYVNLSDSRLAQRGLLDVASTLCTCSNVSDVEVSLGEDKRCLIWFRENKGCEKTLSVRESDLMPDHLVRLAEIVSNCPGFTKLELKNNKLQSEWIEEFIKLLTSSQRRYTVSISVEEHWIRAEEAVSLLCRCLELSNNIQTIRIHHSTLHLSLMKTTVSGEAILPAQSMATNIGLVDCAVVGSQLAPMWSIIQRCHLLTELDFSHNSLDKEGAELLCSLLPLLPSLTSLSVGVKESTVSMAEELSQALQQDTSIKHLNLSGHVISDSAVQNMITFLPRLRSLSLSRCVWSAAAGLQLMETLEQCVSLENLCLDYVQLNERSLLCLVQALRKMNSVESLRLDGWRMAGSGIEQLTRFLPVWKELRVISLSKNLVTDQSGDELLEALSNCTHLQELYLSSNSLGDLTAARMAHVLPSLTRLAVLDISENQIGNEGSASLSKAIKNLKNLHKINLTSVGTSHLSAVAASLVHCPLIQEVCLGWNNCGDDVALELARVLPLCYKMTRVDLESNSVSVCGVEALVGALRSSPALQIIRLWRNKVSPSEAQRLSLTERRLNFSST